ncbi:MAG: PstS family phosphate ABC transporter substrate-binding protein [Actinobacteria bacterium]|nr:PstS family phosphate ABC transporter substrate-binding protein [Actinomycetota bacterium]
MRVNWRTMASLLAVLALLLAACGGGDSASEEAPASEASGGGGASSESSESSGGGEVSGTIEIDGSSTVGPLTDAIAEEYAEEQPNVQVNVGISGTGGGFERFCGEGSTDIANASRPIQEEEAQLCEENGIEFTEIRVGTDALTMVTSPDTEGISCLTTEQVAKIFGPESVRNWSEVNSEFPDEEIQVFAPDTDSGTYDFMVEDALGLEESTQDYNASADDNVIAQGVQGTPYSWGFFGFAYFTNNSEGLKALEYDAGDGCVAPGVETAQNDEYKLTRPLFIYLKNSAVQEKEQVAGFVTFYLETVNSVIGDVGYIEAPADKLEESRQKVQTLISGEDPSADGSSESAS